MLGVLAAATVGLTLASGASANTVIPTFVSATGPVLGVYTYTYSVSLNPVSSTVNSEINSGTTVNAGGIVGATDGDFFALIDFAGYVAGSADASLLSTAGGASWTVSTPATGLTPTDLVTGPDSASVLNIDFQYTGTDAGVFGVQSLVTPGAGLELALGTITLKSTIAPTALGDRYTAQDENLGTHSDQSNQGFVDGPTAVPLPAAAWMGLSTLCGAGALSLLRKRRQ